jgi:4-amino-4-deoxy-L-arabinose transferase-like glycosyltransferase
VPARPALVVDDQAPPGPPPAERPRSRRLVASLVFVALVLIALGILGVNLFPDRVDAPRVPGVRLRDAQLIAHLTPTALSGQSSFLAAAPNGTLVVSDRVERRVLRFDSDGSLLSSWGPQLAPDVELGDPAGVAAGNDAWYVLDRTQPVIIRTDNSGVPQSRIDLRPFNLYGPNGIAVDAAGTLYIADTGGNRILVFGSDGKLLHAVGSAGGELGQLKQPMTVALASDGGLFVDDWENARIERFGPDFVAGRAWPLGYRAWGVAVDSLGRVYTPNTDRHTVDVFAPGGERLAEFAIGASGSSALDFPSQLVLSPDGSSLFVLGHDGLLRMSLETLALEPIQDSSGPSVLRELLGILGGIGIGLLLASAPVRRRLVGITFFGNFTAVSEPILEQPARRARTPRIVRGSPRMEDVAPLQLGRRTTTIALAVVVGVALLVRVVWLATLPTGVHGDEGATGIEAQHILRDGWIGPYSPLALGRPTGPMYLTAPVVALLGNTVVSIRLVPALAGTLTVLALFFMLRRTVGIAGALAGAGVLAVMNWHIHLSRVGFNLADWGLFVVLAAWTLVEAVQRREWRWWAVAGALAGLGVYMYQAHWLLLGVLGLFLLTVFRDLRWRHDPVSLSLRIGVMGAALLIVALPMVLWAADPTNGYFNSFNLVSAFTKPEWLSLTSPVARAAYLAMRYFSFWDRMCCHSSVDGVDGSGDAPVVPALMLALGVVGMVLGLVQRRSPLIVLSALVVVLMPLGAVVTIDGPARRSFAVAPFLALFVGIAAVELSALARRRGRMITWVTHGALAGLLLAIGVQNLDAYFVRFADSANDRWVFAADATDAALYMATLPADRHVYFLSDRWLVTYESVRFLAQNVASEDRSTEFGHYDLSVGGGTGVPVFILLGRYQASLPELQTLYPGGVTTAGGSPSNPSFIAYTGWPGT